MLSRDQLQQCTLLGRFFEDAGREGFSGRPFVDGFMGSETGAHFFLSYDRLQWLGLRYMRDEFLEAAALLPGPKPGPTNPEALFWTGYVYRWWGYQTGETPAEINRQMPASEMFAAWEGYHTLGVDETIERLREEAKERNGRACA